MRPAIKIFDGDAKKNSGRLPIVAIDGPAGAGKSTAARLLAYQLGFRMIDTGALYRALALNAMERNISLSNGPALALLCEKLKFNFGVLEKHDTEKGIEKGVLHIPKLHVYCDGIDVTDSIRTPEMGMAASNVSKLAEVRAALLDVQREFGREGGIVMEGRDIGTVIFPDAEIKFYLSATVESRAKRRWEELNAGGIKIEFSQVVQETKSRDEQDMNRKEAPLRQAPDAILIDSTAKGLDDVLSEMASHVRSYLKK